MVCDRLGRETSVPANGMLGMHSDLVAQVDAEEAAEDAERASVQEVAPGELPLSRVQSRELLSRGLSSPRALSISPPRAGSGPMSPGRSTGPARTRHVSPLGPYQSGVVSPPSGSPDVSEASPGLQHALDDVLAMQDLRDPLDD